MDLEIYDAIMPIPPMVHSRPTQPTGVKLQNKSWHFILFYSGWNQIWKLQGTSKVKSFLWLVLHNRVVTIKLRMERLDSNYILVLRTRSSFILSRGHILSMKHTSARLCQMPIYPS